MIVSDLSGADDDRAEDYRNLTDVGLRRRMEPAQGLFMAESQQVIERALAAGYQPRSVLTTPRWLAAVATLDLPPETPVLVAEETVVNTITGYRVHRGALAAMERLPLPGLAEVLARQETLLDSRPTRVAVLEDIVDHTNVGAAFRSAAAMGVDAVLVTPRCADPLYRRSVRVSMGAVFSLPWTRVPWPDGIDDLKARGYRVVALTPDGSVSLDDLVDQEPRNLALVLGTEGAGVSAQARVRCDLAVRIPMSGGVDSLNVAAAAAVAFYATRNRP